jgi:hypothetical protein
MKIISLGGVGGCELAEALRKLNQPTFPYDWMITTQTFVIDSFNNMNNFYVFDEKYTWKEFGNLWLLDKNKKAIMNHEFTKDFNVEKDGVIAKYTRRFERLNNVLNDKNVTILFVRIHHHRGKKIIDENSNPFNLPTNFFDDILEAEYESVDKWNDFLNNVSNKYNKNIKLLLITSDEKYMNYNNNLHDNLIIVYSKKSNIYDETVTNNYNVIKYVLENYYDYKIHN